MKIKLLDIADCANAITKLSRREFPVRVSYRIQRNLRLIKQETKEYDKAVSELAEKHGGQLSPRGGYAFPHDDKLMECNKEIAVMRNGLDDIFVEVDITAISLDDIGNITPEDLLALEWMFEAPAESQDVGKGPRKRSGKKE